MFLILLIQYDRFEQLRVFDGNKLSNLIFLSLTHITVKNTFAAVRECIKDYGLRQIFIYSPIWPFLQRWLRNTRFRI